MVAACGELVPIIRLTWIDAVLMISPSKLCVLEAVPAEGRGGGVALALVEKTGGGGER